MGFQLVLCFCVVYVCAGIENENTSEPGELAKLWKELKETKAKLETLADKCDNLALKEDERNKKRLIGEEDTLHQVQVDIQNLRSELGSLKASVASDQKPQIGFTAALSNDVVNLGDNQIIIFDHSYTNIGHNYDVNTGIFTCEIPGMYVFYVHTLAEPGKRLETMIVKNNGQCALTYAYDKEAFSSGSNMCVTNLQKGDTVSVRSHGSSHDHDGAIIDYWYTSFSGFLVK